MIGVEPLEVLSPLLKQGHGFACPGLCSDGSFGCFQGWRKHHFFISWRNGDSKTSLGYLFWFSWGTSCSLVHALNLCQWEPPKRASIFFTPSLQVFTYISKILLNLLLRLNSPSSLSYLTGKVLQSLNNLCGPSLTSLTGEPPPQNMILQVWRHQCCAEGQDHLP